MVRVLYTDAHVDVAQFQRASKHGTAYLTAALPDEKPIQCDRSAGCTDLSFKIRNS